MDSGLKKYVIIIAGSLLLLAAIISFVLFRKSPGQQTNILKGVPLDATIIVETESLQQLSGTLRKKNKLWIELSKSPWLEEAEKQFQFIDSLFVSKSEILSFLGKQKTIISYHQQGKDKIRPLLLISLPGEYKKSALQSLISSFEDSTIVLHERKYEGANLQELTGKARGNPIATVAIKDNIFLLSKSSILVEDAIRQFESSPGIPADEGFQKVRATAGKNVNANIYIQMDKLPKAMSAFVKPEFVKKILAIEDFSGWIEADLIINEENLYLSGFSNSSLADGNFQGIFTDQSPGENTLIDVIPSNTAAFFSIHIHDYAKFYENYLLYLERNGRQSVHKTLVSTFEKKTGIELIPFFSDIFANEAGVVVTDFKDQPVDENMFLLFDVKSMPVARERLLLLLKEHGENEAENQPQVIQFDSETRYTIYKIPYAGIGRLLFGNLFDMENMPFFTFLDQHVVFGKSATSLSKFLHFNILNKTLATDMMYNDFAEHMSNRSNFHFYFNPLSGNNLIQYLLRDEYAKKLSANYDFLRNIKGPAYQFNTTNNYFFNNFYIEYTTNVKEQPKTVWETLLDTIIEGKPAFFTNHYTMQNEIVVQDLRNNLYLINNVGRILWKISLPEKIMSDIYEIDFYGNSKYQMLFSTKNYIYILDRNGNNVENYPIRLRSPATNGVALADYENNLKYRFFIAGEDKKVYVYNKDGKILPGWDFEGSTSQVEQPVQHFRIGTKDFIVFGDKYQTYILDRRGNTRVSVNAILPKSGNNNYIVENTGSTATSNIAITDTAGNIHHIFFDGSMEKTSIRSFSSNHFFDFQDVDADGQKDYIFIDKDKLYVYGKNKKELFSYTFDADIQHRPVYFQFSASDRKIGVLNHADNKLYLFNNNGKIYEGFPLEGNTLFSIGVFNRKLSRFNLIAGSRYNFLYNYSVQ